MTPNEQLLKIRELCSAYYTGNAAALHTHDLVWFTIQHLVGRIQTEKLVAEQFKTKPKTFEAHGLRWIPHTPGDPMPCNGNEKVRVLVGKDNDRSCQAAQDAINWHWGKDLNKAWEIVGWNYADPAKEVRA